MIRRGIFLPSRRYFAWSAFSILAIMTLALVAWAKGAGMAARMPGLLVALMVGAASFAGVVGAIDALRRIEASGWSFEEPRASRWIVYYGTWTLIGLGIGLGRAAVFQAGFGLLFAPERLAYELLTCLYMTVILAFALENQTMFLRVAARKQESSRQAVRFLFETREAFAQASALRRHEALGILERQVAPDLAAVQERVARMRAGDGALEDVESLLERLDHLRDTEIREVSHLLHPSIIDMGLAPALRALARTRSDALSIEVEVASVEDLSAMACLQLYRIAEHALEQARAQAARAIRVELTRADAERIRLEIVMLGVGIDLDLARASGAQALLDARVAILGGEWGLERSDDARLVLWVYCPVT